MATDATGTPTTNCNIPKFNTSVDAPSGLGFNAAMDSIDTLLAARVVKPINIVSGEVPVWNGASWDRSSVTRIGPSSLGSGAPSAANFLRGDGTWVSVPSPVTYRKTTAKVVNTTTAATDLLNGEITVAGGVLGTTGMLRLSAWGDWLQNSGANAACPRFQLALGGSVLLDTNALAGAINNATRGAWKVDAFILNTSAATQAAYLRFELHVTGGLAANTSNSFTTGEGSSANTTGTFFCHGYGTTAAGAVNTANAAALLLNVINGSASASYETKLFGAVVEVV